MSLENLVIEEVMTTNVVTLYESDFINLFVAVHLLQQHRIRHIPILNAQNQLLGLVTHESLRQISRPIDLLRLRQVSEVMTTQVICARSDSSMLMITQLMAKHSVSSVMIVENIGSESQPLQTPVGILTERDIVQFQALGLNLVASTADAVMSTPIFSVKPDDSLLMVQQIMEQRFIRRLAVMSESEELLGIVTQSNLLQALNPVELYKLAAVLEEKVLQLEAEKITLLENRTVQLEQEVAVRSIALKTKAEQEKLVMAIAIQIRSSLSLQTILDTTVTEVRKLLGCDRVNIWRFEADWQSIVVAESTDSPVSLVGEKINDICFQEKCVEIYRQGRIRVTSDIYTMPISDCHRQMLIHLHTRAKVLVPLLCGDELWGLLNVTESQYPRDWQPEEVQWLESLSVQLAIALQQATTHQKLYELNQNLERRVEERTMELQALALQQLSLSEQLQTELTERQRAETQLQETNTQLALSNEAIIRATRLKDEFLANMSHELRTPLNAILGMTEGLQEEVFGLVNERQIKALKIVERSSNHLLELINDILDVAKIESGQIELHYSSISIGYLCQSSLAFIKQQALKKNIQLDFKLPPHLPDVLVDERRIRQVLINLLNNAVKFTSEGGRITLEVTQVVSNPGEYYLQIAVIDTGIGISPENIQKLFQPFIQIDSALNRHYTGTGLGLILVKRIVELHSGIVGLTSEFGVGSCFTIQLPYTPNVSCLPTIMADDQNTMICEWKSLATSNQAPKKAPRILLAEDNDVNISTLSSYLEAKGYEILVAKNGQEAVNLAQTKQPNLILMDIQMPGMDGLEAIKQIRLDPSLVDIPIIALTALAMKGDRHRCLEAGANDYLTKPIKLKQLTTIIQEKL